MVQFHLTAGCDALNLLCEGQANQCVVWVHSSEPAIALQSFIAGVTFQQQVGELDVDKEGSRVHFHGTPEVLRGRPTSG